MADKKSSMKSKKQHVWQTENNWDENAPNQPQYKPVTCNKIPAVTEFGLLNTPFGKNVEMEIENADEYNER